MPPKHQMTFREDSPVGDNQVMEVKRTHDESM